NGFSLEIVQADKKVGAGKSGTVVYWSVDNLRVALSHFEELGACLYRGQMEIEDGLSMCQVGDPFGNLMGCVGKTLSNKLENTPLSTHAHEYTLLVACVNTWR
ncbi:hypothetical protein, partial [Vibrio campbellii]|uniref:hypothetical protein n=1 Tax=Vibrio campbellii TaxID=680 RepID=UPI0005760B68